MQGSLLEPWYPMGSASPQKARSYSKDIQKVFKRYSKAGIGWFGEAEDHSMEGTHFFAGKPCAGDNYYFTK